MNKEKLITEEGYKNLQQQLVSLYSDSSTIAQQLELARLDGDISENSAFLLLREKFADCQGKINSLKNYLEKAIIVKEVKDNSLVQLGKQITYQTTDKRKKTVKLVNEFEADPFQGKISFISPFGSLLLNRKIGDTLEIGSKQGKYQIQILEIK